jgi:hypothetical protein
VADAFKTSPIQFDRAEYADASVSAPTCALCQKTLADSYFEVNGQTMCAECTDEVRQAHSGTPGTGGIVKAIGAGIGAGILGALLYYAVLALSGYEFGLIAIVVGLLVGRAVRWGSGGRGGRLYQSLAVVLTYLAIVSCYVPFIIQGFRDADTKQTSEATAGAAAGQRAAADAEPPATGGQIALALAVLGAIVLASPFLAGFQNIIGWLILGFALYEAWKVNRRIHLEVTGPFAITPVPASNPA